MRFNARRATQVYSFVLSAVNRLCRNDCDIKLSAAFGIGVCSLLRIVSAIALLSFCSLLPAQQAMTNDSVVTMTKAGFSEDFIVATIGRSQAAFDTSADGLILLKNAGVVNKVILAIMLKKAGAPTPATWQNNPSPAPTEQTGNKPRVFCEARSHAEGWSASRDQSMEMSKDFGLDCPNVRISVSPKMADYTVSLNHIERGFLRHNQLQVANKNGDLISRVKGGGSIKGDMKRACSLILADWATKQVAVKSP
jgi:hypothetical protein